MPESAALHFPNRAAFRAWLFDHTESCGVWLLFDKRKAPTTLSASEALEEALCFGWIDGRLESLDEEGAYYRKYFAPRRLQSKWSEKTVSSPRSSRPRAG